MKASSEPEQLNKIFEVEEAAQTDLELEQRNHGFPEYHGEIIKTRVTYIDVNNK